MTTKIIDWKANVGGTSGAGNQNIAPSDNLPSGSSVSGLVQAVGQDLATGATVTFSGAYSAKNVSGTVTVLGTGVIPQISADAALVAATCTVVVSGTAVVPQVLGVAGKTMSWMVSHQPMIYVP